MDIIIKNNGPLWEETLKNNYSNEKKAMRILLIYDYRLDHNVRRYYSVNNCSPWSYSTLEKAFPRQNSRSIATCYSLSFYLRLHPLVESLVFIALEGILIKTFKTIIVPTLYVQKVKRRVVWFYGVYVWKLVSFNT